MAGEWTVVLLALFVWAPLSDAVVNKNDLARVVNELLNLYRPTTLPNRMSPPMFSLAISIPLDNMQRYDFRKVIDADPPQNVRTAMDNCQVYQGNRVVAATLLKYPDFMQQCPDQRVTWDYVTQRCPTVRYYKNFDQCTDNEISQLKRVEGLVQHAEYRVLQGIHTLTNRINQGNPMLKNTDLMLFYTYKSPCYTRCCSTSNNLNILTQLSNSIRRWNDYAVVFSNIFVPYSTQDTPAKLEQDRRTAISNLGNRIGGTANIYRCSRGSRACVSCNDPRGVNSYCVV